MGRRRQRPAPALPSTQSTDPFQRIADFNHFVIFDPSKVVGCHDFTYM